MVFRIPKGQSYAWPPCFGLYFNKKSMSRIVSFDITAKYDHPGTADDDDVNKLFGWGYFKGGKHKDSVRFGWTYNNETGRIPLWAYCYVNGERIIKMLCEVLPYRSVLCSIDIAGGVYYFTVCDPKTTYVIYGHCEVPFSHGKKWSYRHVCYFGGSNPAPHEICIKIKRK